MNKMLFPHINKNGLAKSLQVEGCSLGQNPLRPTPYRVQIYCVDQWVRILFLDSFIFQIRLIFFIVST